MVAFFCTKKGVINLSKDRQAGFLVFNQKKHINIPALTGQFYVVSMIVLFRCQTAYARYFLIQLNPPCSKCIQMLLELQR